ncbi:glutathione S-transferase C-terminal domain-containing protein [uncultured Sphingomonas sp.]|uniref:glutathione S-transferase N-terminal domain-containing protein n=1 Tax=uncultured Sphingomonas sp. TaxID=158754 RepID=UPI00260B403D|nr:glutathione S-transferase C-terminal domain-containing protein [uncultured Sphingomonas sp.]
MIDLHYVPTPNGQKVSILLEEAGIEHRLIRYDMLAGDHLAPEFRRISPNGRLPAIVDHAPVDGGAPLTMMESGAILIYLADKHGQFIPPVSAPRARGEVIEWLMWQMAGLGPMHGQAHHFYRYAPEDIDYALARYGKEARRLLTVLDTRLAEAPWVGGAEYSIADMACWPWVRAISVIDIALSDYPALASWFAKVGEREGVKAGTAIQNPSLLRGQKITLTPEQWSNLFGDAMHTASGLRAG